MIAPGTPNDSRILVVRFHPRSGEGYTELLHLDRAGTLHPITRHEHGGLHKLGPPDLEPAFRGAMAMGVKRFVVDLGDVNWIDSTGVGILVGWYQSAQRVGGTLVFSGANATVSDLFKITKLNTVFIIYDTLRAAAEDFFART